LPVSPAQRRLATTQWHPAPLIVEAAACARLRPRALPAPAGRGTGRRREHEGTRDPQHRRPGGRITAVTQPIAFADLRSTVYMDCVPDWAAAELPALYGSFFSTVEYFRIYDEATAISTCILEQPHHVIMFTRRGRDVLVLNKVFAIDPDSATRLCETLFRLRPHPRRIRLEVMFEPRLLGFPSRTLICSEDRVIWLPSTVDAYRASLGAKTRRELGRKWRKLQNDVPGVRLDFYEKDAISEDLVHAVVEMNRVRMRTLGSVSMYDDEQEARLLRVSRESGIAVTVSTDDTLVAVDIMHRVGAHATLQMHGHDPGFASFSVGLRVTYEAVCEAIRRHLVAAHFGWGREDYKQHLGAIAVPTWTTSVYPTIDAKRLALDEVSQLAAGRLGRGLRRLSRPGVRTTARRLSQRWTGAARRGEADGS